MKKVFFCLMAMALCLSCATKRNLPEKMDRFVDKAEATAESKSVDDWEKTTREYEALISEFEENYDSYSPEERRMVYESIGRYNALLVKKGLSDMKVELGGVLDEFQKRLNDLPDAINGILDGVRSVWE